MCPGKTSAWSLLLNYTFFVSESLYGGPLKSLKALTSAGGACLRGRLAPLLQWQLLRGAAGKSQRGLNLLCNLAERLAFVIVVLVFRTDFLGVSFQGSQLLFCLKVSAACTWLSWLAGWYPEGGLHGHSASLHLSLPQFPQLGKQGGDP